MVLKKLIYKKENNITVQHYQRLNLRAVMTILKKDIVTAKIKFALASMILCMLMIANPASPKIILSPLFSDNMVLQQKEKVALWGKSDVGKNITIITSWNNKQYVIQADAIGNWNVKLNTPKAGGPYTITFNDGEELILQNVLIGEVWICSGQSNMEMPVEGWEK